MTDTQPVPVKSTEPGRVKTVLKLPGADKPAAIAAVFLIVILLCAILGPHFLYAVATKQNLRGRNAPPFDLSHSWINSAGRCWPGSSLQLPTPSQWPPERSRLPC